MMRWSRAAALWCTFAPVLAQTPSGAATATPNDTPTATPDEAVDARQVHWQRSLADALAVARATGKPLLLAVNMDGESASDRIVHEQYRDPAFVALTRHAVCLGASVFRHNARDHDDDGRRIPCPRFGCITCGEHMALEPQLWERYLSDGERVAPRHALVLADGTKAFDISLSFDLKDIDRALAAAVAGRDERELPAIGGDWAALAACREANGRTALEQALAAASDEVTTSAALAAIAAHGDAGSLEALRVVAGRLAAASEPVRAALAATTIALQLEVPFAAVLRRMLQDVGFAIEEPGPDARQLALLDVLGRLPDAGSTSLRRAYAAIGVPATDGTRPDLTTLLQTARVVAREQGLPLPTGADAELPSEEELRQRLQQLDEEAAARRGDPAWHAAFARASLDLARLHAETGARDTQFLLEDAASHFATALAAAPDHHDWWLARARAAFLLGRFAEQIEAGERAFAVATGSTKLPETGDLLSSPVLRDPRAIEALRWIGDGHARLLGERAGKDEAVEVAGMNAALTALGVVAASPFGRDRDWVTFGSVAGAMGLWRQELAIVLCGAMRHPASQELRQALNAALWNCGRPDLSGVVAERIRHAHAPSADADWFAGYAWLLVAEDARRRDVPRLAVDAYTRAEQAFVAAAKQNPDYTANCDWFRAVARVGRGHALAQAGDRSAAADALVEAVQVHADLSSLRDGLGYDVLDLVDKIVEWRDDGSQPVEPLALLRRLDTVAPEDPFWAVAVSDSALREALRADGRNPERAVRETVDAGGNPITMAMGLPSAEGDVWLSASIDAGQRAFERARGDDDKLPLQQSAVIAAERELERDARDAFRRAVAAAAPWLGHEGAVADADEAALRALVAAWRQRLGPARPRLREGR